MAISYLGLTGGSVATTVTSIPVTPPDGAVGDLLLAFCWSNNLSAAYTQASFGSSIADTSKGVAFMMRTADASDVGVSRASYNFTRSNGANVGAVAVARFSGVASVDVSSFAPAASGANIVIPTVTPTQAGSLVQFAAKCVGGAASMTPPGTATELFDGQVGSSSVEVAMGTELASASVATGSRTWVQSLTGNTRGGMILLVPAAVTSIPVTRWNGSAEVPVTITRWNGSAEVPVTLKRWNGSVETP